MFATKVKSIKTESEWTEFQSRFPDYEAGLIDQFSSIYENRNIANTMSIDEIAEQWQKPENYYGLLIVQHTYNYLAFALCSGKISFRKYLELNGRIILSDNDATYETAIRLLMAAGYQ